MTTDELKRRLCSPEDAWTERKPENVHRSLVRKTVVAFANSLPEGEEAVLFIGIADNGDVRGVSNADQTEKNVREWIQACYPPISHTSQILQVEERNVVAVIVQPDHDGPHFTGPAFVRVGSESVEATAKAYEELIASRKTKARDILRAKRNGETVSLTRYLFGFEDQIMRAIAGDWLVDTCTSTMAAFRAPGGEIFGAEYSHIRLSRTPDGKQLKVDVDF